MKANSPPARKLKAQALKAPGRRPAVAGQAAPFAVATSGPAAPPPGAGTTVMEVEGSLVSVTPDGVTGWARHPARPTDPVRVILLVNDAAVATAIADDFEIESVRGRVGAGVAGFAIRLAAMPPGPYPATLTLRDARGTLLGTPLVATEAKLREALPIDASQFEAQVEGMRDGVLTGWIWNRAHPDRPVSVTLFDGTDCIDRMVADQHRGDLAQSGKGDGACGFTFQLPARLLDGRAHSLRVFVADTRIELSPHPIMFGPNTISGVTEEVTRLTREVARLGSLVDALLSPNGPLQAGLIRAVSERVAAFSEVQREMVESELDALRAMAFGRMRQLETAGPGSAQEPLSAMADEAGRGDAAGKSARGSAPKAGKPGVRAR